MVGNVRSFTPSSPAQSPSKGNNIHGVGTEPKRKYSGLSHRILEPSERLEPVAFPQVDPLVLENNQAPQKPEADPKPTSRSMALLNRIFTVAKKSKKILSVLNIGIAKKSADIAIAIGKTPEKVEGKQHKNVRTPKIF